MTDYIKMKNCGGCISLATGTIKKGDIVSVPKDVASLKGSLRNAVQSGRLVPVEIDMTATPSVTIEESVDLAEEQGAPEPIEEPIFNAPPKQTRKRRTPTVSVGADVAQD